MQKMRKLSAYNCFSAEFLKSEGMYIKVGQCIPFGHCNCQKYIGIWPGMDSIVCGVDRKCSGMDSIAPRKPTLVQVMILVAGYAFLCTCRRKGARLPGREK